jgi:hypothetical protein
MANPTLTPRAEAEAAARREREAAALRENLRRRKAQARVREHNPVAPNEHESPPASPLTPET